MGHVAVTFNIMPSGPDVDRDAIMHAIRAALDVKDIREKAIGFGLVMLEVLLVFDDTQGADTEAIERTLREIDGVGSVEAGDATLI